MNNGVKEKAIKFLFNSTLFFIGILIGIFLFKSCLDSAESL